MSEVSTVDLPGGVTLLIVPTAYELRKVADVELRFHEGPLAGIRLCGLTVWRNHEVHYLVVEPKGGGLEWCGTGLRTLKAAIACAARNLIEPSPGYPDER